MASSLDPDRAVAALEACPGKLFDQLMPYFFACGNTFTNGYVVLADFLELFGDSVFVWGESSLRNNKFIREPSRLPGLRRVRSALRPSVG